MKKIILLSLAFFILQICNGQDIKNQLCDKKWFPDRIKEVDGKIDELDAETKKLYSMLNCDGTFESWESSTDLVKGKWTYDSKTKTVILTSTNLKPNVITKLKVIRCDGKSFDYITKDGGGQNITIFSKTK